MQDAALAVVEGNAAAPSGTAPLFLLLDVAESFHWRFEGSASDYQMYVI
jgi:hypothetical protein